MSQAIQELTRTEADFVEQWIDTPMGPFKACWTESGLRSFEFGRDMDMAGCIRSSKAERVSKKSQQADGWERSLCDPVSHGSLGPCLAERLESAVREYFRSGRMEWDLADLDWQGVSRFHQLVLRACSRIPTGAVLTYGQLAAQVGSPQAARAVGGAMARNRWPLIIPCHRVIGASGKLTGYSGRGGTQTKQRLLDREGAVVS